MWCLCFSQLTGGLPQAGFRARYDLAVVVPNDGDLKEPGASCERTSTRLSVSSTLTPAAPHPGCGFLRVRPSPGDWRVVDVPRASAHQERPRLGVRLDDTGRRARSFRHDASTPLLSPPLAWWWGFVLPSPRFDLLLR